MERLKQVALLNKVMHALRERENWCGETSVQKTTYLLQEAAGVPFDFEFILYIHGPFSFDLRNELTAERADNLVALQTEPGYGPRFLPTAQGDALATKYPKTLRKYASAIDLVVKWVDDKGIADLERLATAVWVTHEAPDKSQDQRAKRLHEIKPHISIESARIGISDAENLLAQVKTLSQS